MGKKYISYEELQKLKGNKPWEEKSLSKSPFEEIKFPPSTMCAFGSANLSLISCASISIARLNIFREDKNDFPLTINKDQYDVYYSNIPNLYRLIEKPKKEIENHWSEKLPEKIKK